MLNVHALLEPENAFPAFREIHSFGSIPGWSRLYFTVPKDMPEGTFELMLTADGAASNPVQLVVGKPYPAVMLPTNTATGRRLFARGSLATIYALGLGTKQAVADGRANTLEGISVTIDRHPARAPMFRSKYPCLLLAASHRR